MDVILSNSERLHSGVVTDTDVSDHCLVTAKYTPLLSQPKQSPRVSSRVYRDLQSIKAAQLEQLFQTAGLSQFESYCVDDMWIEWYQKFPKALDETALLRRASSTPRIKKCSFMNADFVVTYSSQKISVPTTLCL